MYGRMATCRVVRPRQKELREQGVPRMLADIFADHVDWTEVAALVESGCPGELALEIVR